MPPRYPVVTLLAALLMTAVALTVAAVAGDYREAASQPVAVDAGGDVWQTGAAPLIAGLAWRQLPAALVRGEPAPLVADQLAARRAARLLGEHINREPQPAFITRGPHGHPIVAGGTDGQQLDEDAATKQIADAATNRRPAEVDVETTVADPSPADANKAIAAAARRQDELRAREVTVTIGGTTRTATGRELGLQLPQVDAARARLRGDGFPQPQISRLDDVAADLAAAATVEPRAAAVSWDNGDLKLVDAEAGQRVDTEQVDAALTSAVESSDTTEIEIPAEAVPPKHESNAVDDQLVVRLDERRLWLIEDGAVTASWDVAVGADTSPTPTGEFTVGRLRDEPVWTNPAPSGWGAHMPAVIGPGRSNPLGLRAINWQDGRRDTLIRFHGTADTDSIGEAASRGCVRLANDDVVDLFERVEPGMTIRSLDGPAGLD